LLIISIYVISKNIIRSCNVGKTYCITQYDNKVMDDIKLTDDDFKETNHRTGMKYYNIDEKWVKHILNDQEIVERLRLAISKYDEMGEDNVANILKDILGDVK